jgi:peptidoglycan/LPS O-acetylase OafA/YrhL
MNAARSRIPSLDGIRAVSISLVIYSHFAKDIGWGDSMDLGSLGVRIFFVISGFLITGLLLKELDRCGDIDLRRFYFRRTLRIFPAFYFYLAVILFIAHFGWADLSLRNALPALTYTSNYSVSLQPVIAHTWSLATEEQFYLVWPAVLALVSRRGRALGALLLLMVTASISSRWLSHTFGREVPAFFNSPIGTGCLLALIRDRLHGARAYRTWLRAPMGLLLPTVAVVFDFPAMHVGALRNACSSLAENLIIAAWLDWAVVNAGAMSGRFLNNRWITAIGVGSYSLYLWQQPFTGLLYRHPTLYLGEAKSFVAFPVVRAILISVCTLASYFAVERPLMRLRGRLEPIFFAKRVLSEPLPEVPR